MSDATTTVVILIEKAEGWYRATARDQCGDLCSAQGWDKDKIVGKCQARALARVEGEVEFTVNDISTYSEDDPLPEVPLAP